MRLFRTKFTLLIVLAAVVFVWLAKAPVMASYLSRKLGVPVSIGTISIFPSETTIRFFRINNPIGFKSRTAFSAKKIEIDYQWHELTGSPSTIDRIEMDGVVIGIEFANPLGTKNNWTKIGARMPKGEARAGPETFVRELVLKHITVEIRGLGLMGKVKKKEVDEISLTNINSKEGFPTQEILKQVFGGAGISDFLQDAFEPQNLLQRVLNPFRGFGEMP